MAWFKIKAGAHSYKAPAKDAEGEPILNKAGEPVLEVKVCRGPDSLGYQPGDEFFESNKDLAKKEPARWEASRGPATARAKAKKPAEHVEATMGSGFNRPLVPPQPLVAS